MTLTCSPASMSSATWLWRRSWKFTPSRPASTVAGTQTRLRKCDARITEPPLVPNTRPVFAGNREMCSAMISTRLGERLTVRLLAAVFGGPTGDLAPVSGDCLGHCEALLKHVQVFEA